MSQLLLNKLTKDALLGTERLDPTAAPERQVGAVDQIDQLLSTIAAEDPAHKLLASAGVLAIHGQMGSARIETALQSDTHKPPEPDQPECPADVAELLIAYRRLGQTTLQKQLLEEIGRRGWRMPAESIPNLLKLGAKNNTVRPAVVTVLDNYGRWIAAKNKSWRYALIPSMSWDELNEFWLDSPQQIRLSILVWLRQTNPQKGLALLESRWADEPDANRHALVVALKHGLNLDDESFLEQALDSRQMIVRKRAHELLSMLEESRFSKRMQGYASLILNWHLDRKPFMTVKMPVRMSSSMVRDGLLDQTEKKRADFISRRMTHVVNCVPVDFWTTKTDRTPEEFLQMMQNTTWPRTFLGAISVAIVRQNRPDWARAMLKSAGITPKSAAVLKVLDPADIAPITRKALIQPIPDGKLTYHHPMYMLLKEWKHPWPAEIVLEIGQLLADYVGGENGKHLPSASLRGWLTKLISSSPEHLVEQIETMFTFKGEVHTLWQSAVEKGLRQNESQRQMDAVLEKYLHSLGDESPS